MVKKHNRYRLLHLNLGFFFAGLILSFAISGILLNHREDFNSQTYVVRSESIHADIDKSLLEQSESYGKELSKLFTQCEFRGYRLDGDELRIYYSDAFAFIDIVSGEGTIEYFQKIPVVGQMIFLHQLTKKTWVYYSDIFALALIVITLSGVLMAKGRYSIKNRGWSLILAGLIFPILILLII
ncbi:MAG: PepSY-associated TM helix domain-containing protein [Marinifilaceae bacterium]